MRAPQTAEERERLTETLRRHEEHRRQVASQRLVDAQKLAAHAEASAALLAAALDAAKHLLELDSDLRNADGSPVDAACCHCERAANIPLSDRHKCLVCKLFEAIVMAQRANR